MWPLKRVVKLKCGFVEMCISYGRLKCGLPAMYGSDVAQMWIKRDTKLCETQMWIMGEKQISLCRSPTLKFQDARLKCGAGYIYVIIRRGFAARCAVVITSGRLYSIYLYDNCVLVGRSSAGHKKGWPVVTICPSSFAGMGKGPGGLCETNPAFCKSSKKVFV